MIPSVTVFCRLPRALPIAITVWPAFSLLLSPSRATAGTLVSTLITAMSLVGSVPTMLALAVVAFEKVTVSDCALATTWLLVRI